LAAALLIVSAGCKSFQKRDLVEAELRTRERELAETRAELAQARLLADAYQRSLERQPGCPAPGGPAPALPLRDIVLGSGTGGIDEDNLPGDEALQVVVVPRDDDGSSVKVPGRLTVWAFEITREGLKNPIGTWEVTPEQLRRTWRSGIFATGYYVTLQWDKPPATERLRVAVRLTTLDGRQYEADRDVTVKLLAGVPPPPAPSPVSGPALPTPGVPRTQELHPEELPPPKPSGSFKVPAARLLPPEPLDERRVRPAGVSAAEDRTARTGRRD
jgi:hypothetical protein